MQERAKTGVTQDFFGEEVSTPKGVTVSHPQVQKPPAAPSLTQIPMQLDISDEPEAVRCIPNDLARSALFNVRNHNIKREYCQDQHVQTIGTHEIYYTGQELRQDDESVWLQILHLARHHALGEWVEFDRSTMLKNLGWKSSGAYYKKLLQILMRLQTAGIYITSPHMHKRLADAGLPASGGEKGGLGVSLIRKFEHHGMKRWRVYLEPEVKALFSSKQYSRIDWEVRNQLGPLAQWLHAYYSSHANPLPVKMSTLHGGCGSTAKRVDHFKESLQKSLNELVSAGFLASADIVSRPDSESGKTSDHVIVSRARARLQ